MVYLGNAFSLQMLESLTAQIEVREIKRNDIPKHAKSVIGHQDLADFLGVPMNRVNTKLSVGDVLYVAQWVGGRMPEGIHAMLCPEEMEANIKYLKVWVKDYDHATRVVSNKNGEFNWA